MIRKVLCVTALVSLIFAGGVSTAHAADYVPGEVIVQLQPGASITTLCNVLGLRILGRSASAPVYRMGLPASNVLNPLLTNVDYVLSLLRINPLVVAADPNLVVGFPDGTDGTQWSSSFVDSPRATRGVYADQPSVSQVNYSFASNSTAGAGITVAILDSGISRRHDFLAAQLVPGWNAVNNNANTDDAPDGVDNNGDGRVDEGAGHGTMVAGVVYRFAPGASLMPVKVLDSDGSGTLWNAAEGVRYAATHGAQVVNLSLGSPRESAILDLAIYDANARGALVIAAAGNSDSRNIHSPASNPVALTVAALNADNTKAAFSNFGTAVDVDAPGVSVTSTYWDGTFVSWSGTSFAAPMVTAEAALIRSLAPQLSAGAVRSRIIATSTSVDAWNPSYQGQLGKWGAGLINIDAALTGL